MDYGVMHGRSMENIKEMDFFEYYNRTEGDPEKELVNPSGESFTYRMLNSTVQKISQNFYNTRKADPGDTVAILLPNGCNRIAAILAMAKLGISFCPLEESIPEKKLVFMLFHIKAKCVITDEFESKSRWKNLLEINKIDVKTLLTDSGTVIDNYVSNVRKDSIFCILFTSGSTGMPKAVKITHGNMIQTVEWFRTDFSFEKNEMMCSKTSFIFIDYFTETLSALCMKESCLFLRPDQVQNVKVFLEHLRKYKVTRLYLSVSLLRSLLFLIEKDSENENELNIREVWSSGEDLNQTLVNAFYKLFPRLTLWNVYGSSETCGNSMYSKMMPINIADCSNETCIGETILPEVIIYLVDANGNLINNSLEMGEIWVSGSIVSPGYLFNNDESNKHFHINPFYNTNDVTNEKFKTVYKTGDFAVRREKGIYKVGRNKDFVKIRGNKVNIAEIEKTIQSLYPNNSVGVVTRQVNEVTELFCFISPPTLSVKCVFKSLSSKLMSFMIPRILFLDALPKTDGSDKIDRQKLVTLIPSNKCDFLTQEEILSKPIKSQFEYITGLVLNTDISAIDMDRSFFELGGDSVNVWIYIEKLKTIGMETTFEEISLASLNFLLNKFNKNSDVESILRKNKIKIFDFSEAHDDIVEILFKQHSHAFMETDHITIHLANPNFPKFFWCYMNTVIGSFPQCSFYAMFCEKPVGVAISYPLTAALEINSIPFLNELLSLYEKEVEKKLPSSKFKVLDFSTIHADITLPRETACQVIFELSKRVVEFAIEYKFDAVCTLNSNNATMNIDTRLLGFKHLSTINLNKINVNGEYPYRNQKLKESFVCINYISEEAKKYYAEQL